MLVKNKDIETLWTHNNIGGIVSYFFVFVYMYL